MMAEMRRYLLFLTAGAFFSLCVGPCPARAQTTDGECASAHEKLKKEHETLLNDYNNALAQIKVLMPYKSKASVLEDASRQFDVVKQGLAKERDEALKEAAGLKEKIHQLDENIVRLTQEREEYKKSFEKASIENIIGEETRKKIAALEKENALSAKQVQDFKETIRVIEDAALKKKAEIEFYKRQVKEARDAYEEAKKNNQALQQKVDDVPKKLMELSRESRIHEEGFKGRIRALESAALKKEAELELYRRQLQDSKAKYDESKKTNRALERKIDDVPRRFTELARENKILIKRTATMHYNLGVFYTQNREFERALAEFEKAVELNPEDSASYFNLGYIYAEHLQNRPKAVASFKQFLKLAKRDDKDADWVKRYVLTWQAWEGSVPIK